MKRLLIAVCLLMLAFSTAARAEATSQTGSYNGSLFFFAEDCEQGLGAVCFTVFRDDISSIHVEVDDASPFSITAHAEVLGPGGAPVAGGNQFCDATDIAIPHGTAVAQVIVHVGGFMQGECGPIPFVDPFEGNQGSLTPATVGTVTITY